MQYDILRSEKWPAKDVLRAGDVIFYEARYDIMDIAFATQQIRSCGQAA
jgi:hypothetical protein